MQLTTIKLRAPYLIFFGDVKERLNAKTGLGIAYWAPDRCAGQMKFAECSVESGLPNLCVADQRVDTCKTIGCRHCWNSLVPASTLHPACTANSPILRNS
jgi:hypothetical protein